MTKEDNRGRQRGAFEEQNQTRIKVSSWSLASISFQALVMSPHEDLDWGRQWCLRPRFCQGRVSHLGRAADLEGDLALSRVVLVALSSLDGSLGVGAGLTGEGMLWL